MNQCDFIIIMVLFISTLAYISSHGPKNLTNSNTNLIEFHKNMSQTQILSNELNRKRDKDVKQNVQDILKNSKPQNLYVLNKDHENKHSNINNKVSKNKLKFQQQIFFPFYMPNKIVKYTDSKNLLTSKSVEHSFSGGILPLRVNITLVEIKKFTTKNRTENDIAIEDSTHMINDLNKIKYSNINNSFTNKIAETSVNIVPPKVNGMLDNYHIKILPKKNKSQYDISVIEIKHKIGDLKKYTDGNNSFTEKLAAFLHYIFPSRVNGTLNKTPIKMLARENKTKDDDAVLDWKHKMNGFNKVIPNLLDKNQKRRKKAKKILINDVVVKTNDGQSLEVSDRVQDKAKDLNDNGDFRRFEEAPLYTENLKNHVYTASTGEASFEHRQCVLTEMLLKTFRKTRKYIEDIFQGSLFGLFIKHDAEQYPSVKQISTPITLNPFNLKSQASSNLKAIEADDKTFMDRQTKTQRNNLKTRIELPVGKAFRRVRRELMESSEAMDSIIEDEQQKLEEEAIGLAAEIKKRSWSGQVSELSQKAEKLIDDDERYLQINKKEFIPPSPEEINDAKQRRTISITLLVCTILLIILAVTLIIFYCFKKKHHEKGLANLRERHSLLESKQETGSQNTRTTMGSR